MRLKLLTQRLAAAGIIAAAGFGLAHYDVLGLGSAHAAAPTVVQAAAVPPAAVTSNSAAVTLPNFTTLVQRFGPAVVNITVTARQQQTGFNMGGGPNSDDPFFQFFKGIPGFTMPPRGDRVVHGLGSGFIVSPDGYIMTNAHVVSGATEVTVKLTDRREYKAKVIGADKKSDIAVIKIDAKNLPVVTLGNADAVQVGEWVLAIGSPFGFENSVTSGIVSAKGRPLPDDSYTPFIQTDVPVNPGNSGGPLFNMNGDVIGINSQIFSETGGYQGLSFAIPINIAVKVKDDLIAHGKVTRGRLGVTIQEVNQQLANSFGLPRPMGALVSEVQSDGPAANSGLKAGDVITQINGRAVERSADLPAVVSELKPGSRAQLQVYRQGKPTDIAVTIGELSDTKDVAAAQPAADHGRLGLALRPLAPEERAQLGGEGGLLVEQVSGPAQAAGVQPGDVVLAVNGTPVRSIEQLRSVVNKATDNVALLIQRQGNKLFVPIDLG
ncbi:MAG: DegQ family serine endoprotease [Burkholderiaceae bacterium]|jgi:serine protease Do